MERRASSVMAGNCKESGGAPPMESGPLDMAMDPVSARTRLPYPFCLAIQNGNENSLREAVRLLVEGAV